MSRFYYDPQARSRPGGDDDDKDDYKDVDKAGDKNVVKDDDDK